MANKPNKCFSWIANLSALLVVLIFSACEKVIDLKLDNVEPVIVIEGNINDRLETQFISISRTYNFEDRDRFNAVSGASVSVTTASGQKINFTETRPGVYSAAFRGSSDRQYVLNVVVNGKTYTATSTMPKKVELTGISFRTFAFFGNSETFVAVKYNDPPGIQNQYRYIIKVNDTVKSVSVGEDRFDDGNSVVNTLFADLDDFKSGDRIEVEMQTIDRKVFRYYYTIEQAAGGGGPPVAPSNPDSNFNNGALGYFSAHTSSILSTVYQ